MKRLPYPNRTTAGRELAKHLEVYHGCPDAIVLGLPRGGVPVAFEVAQALEIPLDILVVRKLGLPGMRELAMGAIASGGVVFRNEEVLSMAGVSGEEFGITEREEREELLRRERAYRGERPLPCLTGRCVILVDDGLATGSTLRAAIEAVKRQNPSKLVAAVPVGAGDSVHLIERHVDEVVCPAMPADFQAIGRHYEDFSQVDDEEVRTLLGTAWASEKSHPLPHEN